MSCFNPASKQIQRADGSYVGNGTHRFVVQVICMFAIAHLYFLLLCLHISVYYLSSISDWVLVMTMRQINRTSLHVRLPSRT